MNVACTAARDGWRRDRISRLAVDSPWPGGPRPEGLELRFDLLIVGVGSITAAEAQAAATARWTFGLVDDAPLCGLAVSCPGFLGPSGAWWHPALEPAAAHRETAPRDIRRGGRHALTIAVVDTDCGLVRHLRSCSVSPELTARWYEAITRQEGSTFDADTYFAKFEVVDQLGGPELALRTVVTCRSGD